MTAKPEVSVVMSVYNGAKNLDATLRSVLGQQDCDFEFIVVNDGSSDGSGAILDRQAALDPRLKVIHQANAGLTQSLIRGCGEARGDFIARQDADDLSLPGRLRRQADHLRNDPEAVLVASGLRFLAPGGEWVSDFLPAPQVTADLAARDLRLPPLVATCFRRDTYRQVGGFRPTFTVAQDIDMWLRLIQAGPCRGLQDIHYAATLTAGGISARRRTEQLRLAALAIECARRRGQGLDDATLLAAHVHAPPVRAAMRPRERAAFHYFIGASLRRHDPVAAKRYFDLALRDNPFHLKALVRRWTPLP